MPIIMKYQVIYRGFAMWVGEKKQLLSALMPERKRTKHGFIRDGLSVKIQWMGFSCLFW